MPRARPTQTRGRVGGPVTRRTWIDGEASGSAFAPRSLRGNLTEEVVDGGQAAQTAWGLL
jgi:hypothetical protein